MRTQGDRGSLPMALLLVLMGAAVSALLLPMVLTQVTGTRRLAQRQHALDAALAGVQAAVGQLRAANDGNGNGVPGALPACNGTLAGDGFTVTVYYLAVDPRGQSEQWARAHAICTSGEPATAPAYALLVAYGTDGTTTRTTQATYTFHTTNQQPHGGLVRIMPSQTLCLDAGSPAPAAGTSLLMEPCDASLAQQKFAYQADLTLVLASTRTGSAPGLCVDAGATQNAGNAVQLQACVSPAPARQQWSFDDHSSFRGTTDGNTLDDFCIRATTAGVTGSPLRLGSISAGTCTGGGAADDFDTWAPEAAVGAGAAGTTSDPTTHATQLVNLSEFGRCLDVPDFDVSRGYLIAWPCKQAPNPANVSWNQMWVEPSSGPGAIYTTTSSTTYCLRSPRATGAGQYVSLGACAVGAPTVDATWTVYRDTGDYTTAYRIVDSAGYCLQPTDPNAPDPDFFGRGYHVSKLVVAVCNNFALQKWNAPPNIVDGAVKDVGER